MLAERGHLPASPTVLTFPSLLPSLPSLPPSSWPPCPSEQQQVVGLEAKVAAIAEMGFGREQALAALKRANGDEQQAMELLLGA